MTWVWFSIVNVHGKIYGMPNLREIDVEDYIKDLSKKVIDPFSQNH